MSKTHDVAVILYIALQGHRSLFSSRLYCWQLEVHSPDDRAAPLAQLGVLLISPDKRAVIPAPAHMHTVSGHSQSALYTELECLLTPRNPHQYTRLAHCITKSKPEKCIAFLAKGLASLPGAFLAISLADAHTDHTHSLDVCAVAEAASGHLVLVSSQLCLAHDERIPQRVCNIACLHQHPQLASQPASPRIKERHLSYSKCLDHSRQSQQEGVCTLKQTVPRGHYESFPSFGIILVICSEQWMKALPLGGPAETPPALHLPHAAGPWPRALIQ